MRCCGVAHLSSPVLLASTEQEAEGRRSWRAAGVVALLGLLAAAALSVVLAVDTRRIAAVRDVMAIATARDDLPYYAAWGTYTGVLAWVAASAVLLLGARLVAGGPRRTAGLLVGGAVVALLLAVDDLYMLHDAFLLQRGVDERVSQAVVVLVGLGWVLRYGRRLRGHPETPVLAVAVVLLAHSALSDVTGDLLLHEEATKLASALSWAVWAYRTVVTETAARPVPSG